jgi:hypothetical protein
MKANNPVRHLKTVMQLPLGSKQRHDALIFNDWAVDHCFGAKRRQKLEALRDSMKLRQDLKDLAVDGMVNIEIWSRDCDLCESTRITKIPANMRALNELENDQYEYAEGPVSIRLVDAEYAEGFEASFRDRAAEMMNY